VKHHTSDPATLGIRSGKGRRAGPHVATRETPRERHPWDSPCFAGLLEQLELQKKLDAQLLQQRNTQSALDLRMHTAGPGPTLRPAQLQRLARHTTRG
jgi:hypothetical protein